MNQAEFYNGHCQPGLSNQQLHRMYLLNTARTG